MTRPTMEEIIDELRSGERRVLDDADAVDVSDDQRTIICKHRGSDDDVWVEYTYREGWTNIDGYYHHETTVLPYQP